MKNVVIVYIVILTGIFAVFSLLDRKSEYVIEAKIWKIYKEQIEIAKDPKVISSHNFDKVINDYKYIIEQFPESRLIPRLYIRIGEIYALRGDYKKAREIFLGLNELYPDRKELIAEATFQAGKTYEVVGNWQEASKIYNSVTEEFPLTNTGLSVPIYMANYYRNLNDFQGTMDAYEIAIFHYKKIAATHENKRVGMQAMRHLANCYLDQNRWIDAIDTLGVILEKYSSSDRLSVENVDMIIKTINITAAYQIKNYEVAISTYEGIIARNPGHPLNKYLTRVIDAFSQLKEQGVDVTDR